MKIDLFYKNITSEKALEVFVNEKIGSLEKFVGNAAEVRVELGMPSKHHRSGPIFYAEVNLKFKGKLFRGTNHHADLRIAIVNVKNELQKQINKFKEKVTDTARKPRVSKSG